ncbi:Dihydroorotate dehydrogenase-domain-containing protein [Rhodocollybia butyracea]|uniref:Dihydroorotate dehydrogenase (quinone), mitochondrial n=1 Tax=Rhodocollybia butyracea TaxID=206335 RepID=A0A9P5TV95_9AGAR|nr:Dihydroorotate dehydrogenase-domain-containing protein [Rhodocollybia butyracea]
MLQPTSLHGLFAVYYFDPRSAIHKYVIMPVLRHTLDAEASHKIAVKDHIPDDEKLVLEIWGQRISNPVGLAAGFDKRWRSSLLDLGFSWVEIGSVTPNPQPGNPKPRVFRLPEDNAVINRYGFPSQGHATVLSRVRARLPTFLTGHETSASLREGSLLAVNLGKNKESPADSIDDFVAGVKTFGPYSDVLVVNVSSPNTPGLRGLQNKDSLESAAYWRYSSRDILPPSYLTSRRPRLVLKIAPDLTQSQIEDIADVIKSSGIDGVIVSNTQYNRTLLLRTILPLNTFEDFQAETGGLSGPPIKPYSLAAVKTLRANLPATIPIIGCGGISTVYTSFSYDGVGTCRKIKDQIVETLQKEGTTWAEVVKKAVNELSLKEEPRKVKPGEGSVKQLIEEAEHLHELWINLGQKWTR